MALGHITGPGEYAPSDQPGIENRKIIYAGLAFW